MPVMSGTIYRQDVGYRIQNSGSTDVSLNMSFRDLTADAAISLLTHTRKDIWAECGFSSINSHEVGIEDEDPPIPRVARRGVVFLTFRTSVFKCRIRARWAINFWTDDHSRAAEMARSAEPELTGTFLGYDKQSAEVFYTHEVYSEPGVTDQSDGRCDVHYMERTLHRRYPDMSLEVIEAPANFRLRQGIAYRVDPVNREIEPVTDAATYGQFLNSGR